MILAEHPLCSDPFGTHAERDEVAAATDVHHIVPLRDGGDASAENLQPLCRACHSRMTKATLRVPWFSAVSPSTIPITLVAGPPGSGKTAFVHKHASWGDLIIDVDALYAAVSGLAWYEKPVGLLPFVMEARDAIIKRLARQSDVRQAWLITGEADVRKLAEARDSLGARLLVIPTSPSECMLRISRDERRAASAALWEDLVRQWWDTYTRTGVYVPSAVDNAGAGSVGEYGMAGGG